jgi:hypothetical protein
MAQPPIDNEIVAFLSRSMIMTLDALKRKIISPNFAELRLRNDLATLIDMAGEPMVRISDPVEVPASESALEHNDAVRGA